MASKKLAEKFGSVNKSTLSIRVNHTRTGACTSKGRCYHGRPKRRK